MDQTIQSIEGSTGAVRGQIEKARTAGMLQIEQDYEDIFWEADGQMYDVSGSGGGSASRNVASAALSGLSTYFTATRGT